MKTFTQTDVDQLNAELNAEMFDLYGDPKPPQTVQTIVENSTTIMMYMSDDNDFRFVFPAYKNLTFSLCERQFLPLCTPVPETVKPTNNSDLDMLFTSIFH